ncbi:hypothetical protein BDN72DRAFT_438768 [Pluteus cervinus]|uniref:Uncharacterized protein n=1 Tax=Pluteus cervinus TaxID=181527 RepID=A0ACD3A815_9AGAR|nr:hypothetical protein BDN72DRAFT_438768 [Pluteus cervinus]
MTARTPILHTVPSENWDDDFEFQSAANSPTRNEPTTTKSTPGAGVAGGMVVSGAGRIPDFEPTLPPSVTRMSTASSHFTEDWDAESTIHHDNNHMHISTTTILSTSTTSQDSSTAHLSSSVLSTSLANWAEPGPSTPPKRSKALPPALSSGGGATENWDDDFEDSPMRTSSDVQNPARSRKTPTGKPSHSARPSKSGGSQPRPESWDEEFEMELEMGGGLANTAGTSSTFGVGVRSNPASPSKRRRAHRTSGTSGTSGGYYSTDSDSDGGGTRPRRSTHHHHHAYHDENRVEDDDLEFGYADHDKEEDKTVTARSRRVALSRIVSPSNANTVNNTPPPPVPPLPYIPHSGQPTRPYPRSPTASVFSVPPPQSSRSTSASTSSSSQGPHATSTTQLRPTLSHTSFLSNLPPSPPIHKERERRRLRKKSRPPPQQLALAQNTYEMGNISRIGYDLPEENEGQVLMMRPTSPGTPVTPSPKLPPETPSSMHSTPASHTSNLPSVTSPPPSTGKSALLSRIGSVKKWGVRRKRGSTTPAEVESRFAEQQDMDLTPRPQSSLSSIPNSSSIHNTPSHSHSSHGRDSRAGAHSPTPPPSNPSWFFRATSGSSSLAQRNGSMSDISMSGSVPAHERSGGKSRERERTEKMLDRERERDLMYTPSPEGSLSSRRGGGPETPNKLSKRKSLGFAQLRRGIIGGGEKGGESSKGSGGDSSGHGSHGRPMSMQAPSPRQAFSPGSRHASYTGIGRRIASETDGRESSVDDLVERREWERVQEKERQRRRSTSKPCELDRLANTSAESSNYGDSMKGKEKEGGSGPGFMRSVRKLSLVGRHKRTKSGTSLSGLGEQVLATIASASRENTPQLASPVHRVHQPQPRPSLTNLSLPPQLPPPLITTPILKAFPHLQSSPSGSPTKPRVEPGHPLREASSASTDSTVSNASTKTTMTTTTSSSVLDTAPTLPVSSFTSHLLYASNFSDDDDTAFMSDSQKTPSGPQSRSQVLLPPIELQPPSPPRTIKESDSVTISGRDAQMQGLIELLNPSTSSPIPLSSTAGPSKVLFNATPSSSSKPNTGDVSIPRPSTPPISPARKTGSKTPRTPGSPQAASLGRTTGGTVGAATASAGGYSGLGSGAGGMNSGGNGNVGGVGGIIMPRRNSLGDLKIPARISQAQVGLRRDLGMVREFAANVEQLKDLQWAYSDLITEVQAILDQQVHLHAQQQQQRAQAASSPSRAASPSFFANISRPKARGRSNTNPQPDPPAHFAYKQFASSYYTINSKYRISWECAELLIELGGGGVVGSAGGGGGGGSSSGRGSSQPPAPSSSVSAPSMNQVNGILEGPKKGRERAITLAGDESKPSTPTATISAHSSTIASSSTSPPLATPSAWRASTGRNDLSQRQLLLLKEMLSNPDSFMDELNTSIPEESAAALALASSSLLNVNRDWRWGDAMNSTITLPSEESSGLGGQSGGTSSPKKKRRTSRLGMAGLRDMLKLLKRSYSENPPPLPTPPLLPTPPIPASSTSLSTESSTDGHRYPTQTVPQPGRRRAKTSTGPESMRSISDTRPSSPYNPSSLTTTKPSPRRPSIASIFRLGKTKSTQAITGPGSSADTSMESFGDPSKRLWGPGQEGSGAGDGDEEDWDRIEFVSDMDAAARALGIGTDGTATVRGSNRGRSPYLHGPPPSSFPGSRSGSPKRTASASQVSLGSISGVPQRQTRLSNVEELNDVEDGGGAKGKGRVVSSSTLDPDKPRRTGASPSRPTSTQSSSKPHRNTLPPPPPPVKTGSVRSMPPQPIASGLPDPKLAMTPENIKPLLENAREVHARLNECIVELKELLSSRPT